jgi:cell filamentation protein
LCYPDSTVLRNKAGIQNQAQLDAFELEMVLSRSTEPWPSGQVDAAHYLSLHHYLFQDVYDWAGTIRSIRIGKDGSWFCYPEHIAGEMEKLFNWLAAERQFKSLRGVDFASKAARSQPPQSACSAPPLSFLSSICTGA